jgi:light-regulated signal transduction histidine kinase (bacteriophytochrome)
VRDNGVGIETKKLDKLFMLFERLHTRQEYPAQALAWQSVKKSWGVTVGIYEWHPNQE